MKLLFAGVDHYPEGGISDLCHEGTEDDCKAIFMQGVKLKRYGWGQIVDRDSLILEQECFFIDRSGQPEWRSPSQLFLAKPQS